MIYHISLDVWNTLVKPNPEYAHARSEYLNKIARQRRTLMTGKEIYLEEKKRLDVLAEEKGEAPSLFENHVALVVQLGYPSSYIHIDDIAQANLEEFERLFNKYPPFVDPRVEALMWDITTKFATRPTFSITSNTNFIGGRTLKKFFGNRFPFAFQLYSDEERMSKPNPKLFDKVVKYAEFFHTSIKPEQIAHIGDHAICDRRGADEAGLKGHQITDFAYLHMAIDKVARS